jgi:hypothetical protein
MTNMDFQAVFDALKGWLSFIDSIWGVGGAVVVTVLFMYRQIRKERTLTSVQIGRLSEQIGNVKHAVEKQRKNACYRVTVRHPVPAGSTVTSDQTIRLTGVKAERCAGPLRRIGYRDPATGKHYVFLTNNFRLSSRTIATIYKERWQIELFFKWIKQYLRIKTFLGTSHNAVLTQIWVAMCLYLLLAYIRFMSKPVLGMQQILRLLQLNLFERRDLMALLRGDPPQPITSPLQARLQFA